MFQEKEAEVLAQYCTAFKYIVQYFLMCIMVFNMEL